MTARVETEPVATFPALFAEIVASRNDHPALILADETLTYGELDRRSARMARALLASGAGKGTRIALLAPDGALWLTTFYAALRIGALITPVSTLLAICVESCQWWPRVACGISAAEAR